uniref:glycosyltransferase n=1 Tax=Mariniflexile sp. TaxID=1979402 RepID=UPI0040481F6E
MKLTKRKILFVLDSLGSGGAEKDLVTVLNLINKEKYDIDLLTFIKGGLYENIVPNEITYLPILEYQAYLNGNKKSVSGFKTIKFFLVRVFAAVSKRIYDFFTNLFKIRKLHPAQLNWLLTNKAFDNLPKKYDVAIAFSQGLPTYFIIEKVNSKVKAGWVNTDYKKANYSSKFDSPYYDILDRIINISPKGEEIFLEFHHKQKHKCSIIYNIISKEIITKMSLKEGDFPTNFSGLKLLTIGRLVPPKGYDLAIKACKILKEKNIKYQWYAIGEGPLKSELQELAKELDVIDSFVFLGTFPNPYPFIKKCDIYCQPSVFEGFGIALAEAKILCKPIVATNFEVVYDQIRHEENGLIVDMDPMALANGIEKLAFDKELNKKVIENLKKEDVGTEAEIIKIETILNLKK